MYILGISSAGKILEVALTCEANILAQFSLSGETQRGENLVLYIDNVLKGITNLEKISGLAVTTGPGSYGGLRGGLSLAKSIAHVYNIPIIPVSTLEAIAYNLANIEGTIVVAISACKNDLNFALFGARQGSIKRLTDDFILNKDVFINFVAGISGDIYFLGDSVISAEIAGAASPNVRIGDPLFSLPRACNVARLGEEKLKRGGSQNFITALPRYSHAPNIREYKRKSPSSRRDPFGIG